MYLTIVNESEIPAKEEKPDRNVIIPKCIIEMIENAVNAVDNAKPGEVIKVYFDNGDELFLFFKGLVDFCREHKRRDIEKITRTKELAIYLKRL